jgi:hypothetical protein
MSWLSELLTGNNPTLDKDKQQLGQQAGFDTGEGQSDITAGDTFLKSILSGDATKQAQVLAPEISAAKTSQQQDQKTLAQNGTRSGGTAASSATAADKTHATITDLLASLTGKAATALPSIGTTLTGQGTSATQAQAQVSQEQMQNFINSILGKSAGQVGGAATTAGLDAIGL